MASTFHDLAALYHKDAVAHGRGKVVGAAEDGAVYLGDRVEESQESWRGGVGSRVIDEE